MHTILCESVLNIICNCPKQGMVAQLSSLTVWLIGDFCWYLNLLIETLKNCIKRWSVYFTICSKQGPIGDFCWYLNLLIETLKNCIKRWSVYFTICSKQGPKMEGAALHVVGILGLFLVLKRVRVSYPQRHPNRGQVHPPPHTPVNSDGQ